MILDLTRRVNTLIGVIVSGLVAFAGFALIGVSCYFDKWGQFYRDVTKEVGATLLGIGVLAFLWELFTKRSFREETLLLAGVASSVDEAGLEIVTLDYHDVPWKELFEQAKQLHVFFAYASTWRSVHGQALKALASQPDISIRVVLPNVTNEQIASELCRRFGYELDKLRQNISDTVQYFEGLATHKAKNRVQIRYVDTAPLFAIYNFGPRAVVTTYKHSPGKGPVPTLVLREGGKMFNFSQDEFDHLWKVGKESCGLSSSASAGTQSQ